MNQPAELTKVLQKLEQIQKEFNSSQSNGKKVSLADLIVLGGCAAPSRKLRNEPGCRRESSSVYSGTHTDASQKQTDAHAFAVLEPKADGFRNYLQKQNGTSPEELLVDRAQLLNLDCSRDDSAAWRHARTLDANFGQSKHGVFTKRPETLRRMISSSTCSI